MNLKAYQSQLIAAAMAMMCSAAQSAALPINAGDKVTWVNKDDEPHSVVSDNGLFRSGAMDTNESYSFKFDKPGTYHCQMN